MIIIGGKKMFIKKHKILCLIFGISMFFMIKNSTIPYPFIPSKIIAFLFDAPQNEGVASIAKIIDIFASAYVTSLIFYYMVTYIPNAKEQKKAEKIIEPKLINLYSYISELLAMIKYSAELNKLDDIKDFDKLKFESKNIKCKKKTIKNEQDEGVGNYYYSLLFDCDEFRKKIIKCCEEISCTPSFIYCDMSIIHIISEIRLSELLCLLPESDDRLSQNNSIGVTYIGIGNGYENLLSIRGKLGDFVSVRLQYEMMDISPDELKNWENREREQLKTHPIINQLIEMDRTK